MIGDRIRRSLHYRVGKFFERRAEDLQAYKEETQPKVKKLIRGQQRFVLFAHTRTGSYNLVSLLDSHPEIECHGELLQPVEPSFSEHVAIIGEMESRWHDPAYRRENYEEFLGAFYNRSAPKSDYTIQGFKLIAGQHDPAMVYCILNPTIKIIYLHRSNILATYSSEKIAKLTGQDRVQVDSDVKSAITKFDPKEFESRRTARTNRHNLYKELLNRSRKKYFEIEYNDILKPKTQRDLLSFLGALTDFELTSEYKKRNSSDIVNRFANPDDVVRHLDEIGHPEWASELDIS